MPLFLIILLGVYLRKAGWIDENFVNISSKIVFNISMPLLLFKDLLNSNLTEVFDLQFVILVVSGTVIFCIIVWIGAEVFIKEKYTIGTFVQCAFRGNFTVLGVALITGMYGNAGKAPLVAAVLVLPYNVLPIIALTARSKSADKTINYPKMIRSVLTNHLIIGAFAAIFLSFFHIKLPVIFDKTIASLSSLTLPLALLGIGGSFQVSESLGKLKPALAITIIKLLVLPLVMVPIAISIGYRGQDLAVLLLAFGSPSAVAGYAVARAMQGDEILCSNAIVCSTGFSLITLTAGIFLLKSFTFI